LTSDRSADEHGRVTTSEGGRAATLERCGDVAVITLNRSHALNAVDAALSAAVGEALDELQADPGLRVGVVTGAGRAFCAGADLKAIAAGRSIAAPDHPEWGFAGLVEHAIDKPLVAAVNGFALGGGTEIVLACDLAVLSDEASLGLPEVTRGLFAGAGGLIHLPRQLPLKVAMEVALVGDPIPPVEALRWGLVNRVVPTVDVLPTALELARRVAANAPLSVRTGKKMVRAAVGADSDWDRDLWALQGRELGAILGSRDAVEGATAFAEKRPPAWSGE
jgi:crotonobetainyl-CoA hydratase